MRSTRSLLAFVAAVLLAAGLVRPGAAQSQVATPTPEQMEILRTLTPEQQDALLRQITGGAGIGTGTTTTTGGDLRTERRDEQGERRDGTTPLDRTELQRTRPLTDEDLERTSPYLKGDDWVIIKIDLPQTDPTQAAPLPPNSGVPLPNAPPHVLPNQ